MKDSKQQNDFLELLKPVLKNLEKYSLALTHDREKAKELAADTIAAAWESFGKLNDKQAFLSYLFTIASRKFSEQIKIEIKRRELSEADISQLYAGGISPEDASDITLLYDALNKLDENTRQALILAEIIGIKQDEVAKIRGAGLSAVKMRIKRGKEKLRELLGIKIKHSI